MNDTTLYKQSSNGKLMEWSVGMYDRNYIAIRWGYVNGSKQLKKEQIHTNQSGRSLAEQMCLRMDSRVNHQLDLGYKRTMEEARVSAGTNASDLLRPMLAKTYSRDKALASKSGFWQYKYNGHRCLITRQGDNIIAYSRNGKVIDSINHIIEDSKFNIPEGVTLDGELYIHGQSLQSISSLVRRNQPDSAKLQYIVYDTILKNSVFEDRLDFLQKDVSMPSNMILALTYRGYSPDMASKEHLKSVQSLGYEGLMFRDSNKGYEPGKRSSQLQKVKMCLDCEAKVIDIFASKDGWAILDCVTQDGYGVRVSAPGTIEEKTHILNHSEDYIGKMLTIEFAEYTADNVPFHPVAIAFRKEE